MVLDKCGIPGCKREIFPFPFHSSMSDELEDTTRILESNGNMKVRTNVFLLIQDFPRSKIAFLLAVSDTTSE